MLKHHQNDNFVVRQKLPYMEMTRKPGTCLGAVTKCQTTDLKAPTRGVEEASKPLV